MGFQVVTSVEADYLRLIVDDVFSLEKMLNFIEYARGEADRTKRAKVLIDCRSLHGSMSEADRFQGGQHFANVFGPRIKTAVIMPEGEVTKLGEMTARNRGANLLVTESVAEAEAWLLAA